MKASMMVAVGMGVALAMTASCSRAPKVLTLKLPASYDFEYGYSLLEPDGAQYPVQFESQAAEQAFADAFGSGNLSRSVGRKIICDCTGFWPAGQSGTEFHVTTAAMRVE